MKELTKVKYIIIHCSDTPWMKDFTARDINRWQVEGRGWTMIGYHYVVRLDGTIEQGRPEYLQGAHCAAQGRNKDSLGICYIGGRDAQGGYADSRTEAQKQAIKQLVSELQKRYPQAQVAGHRDFDKSKLCPCYDV